jgi:hypothetical protein
VKKLALFISIITALSANQPETVFLFSQHASSYDSAKIIHGTPKESERTKKWVFCLALKAAAIKSRELGYPYFTMETDPPHIYATGLYKIYAKLGYVPARATELTYMIPVCCKGLQTEEAGAYATEEIINHKF